MQRARRLASIAVVAVVATSGLTACRSEPDVAAYVGTTTISEDRVEDVYVDARDKLAASVRQVRAEQAGAGDAAAQQDLRLQISRSDVVSTLVGLHVLRAIAQQRKITPTSLPAEGLAQAVSLPADTKYVELYREYRGYLDAFAQKIPPARPTEQDLRDVYDRLKAGGALGADGGTLQQFAAGLSEEDQQVLRQNIGVRNDLNAALTDYQARVNPRYGAPELPLVSFRGADGKTLPLVVLSFVRASAAPAVTDVS